MQSGPVFGPPENTSQNVGAYTMFNDEHWAYSVTALELAQPNFVNYEVFIGYLNTVYILIEVGLFKQYLNS